MYDYGFQNPRDLKPQPAPKASQVKNKRHLATGSTISYGFFDFERVAESCKLKTPLPLLHVIGNLSSGSQDRAVAVIMSRVVQD